MSQRSDARVNGTKARCYNVGDIGGHCTSHGLVATMTCTETSLEH